MAEGKNGQPVDLAGGVDLDTPVLKDVRNFASMCVQKKAQAAIMIGIAEDGQMFVKVQTPSGKLTEALGILTLAQFVISQPTPAEKKE